MKLYLVQHGAAVDAAQDPDRPLSEAGLHHLHKIKAFIDRHRNISVKTIYHSPKTRAKQTAQELAIHLSPDNGLVEDNDIVPMGDITIWAKKALDETEDIMLVGHLPHLDRLASYLLTGKDWTNTIHFEMGGIVCLQRETDKWSVSWMVTPQILT